MKKVLLLLVEVREETHGIEGVGARETWINDAFARLMVPLITPQAEAKGRADFAKLKALAEAK